VSGTYFQVDLQELEQLISDLGSADQLMSDALNAMKSTGGSTSIGTSELDQACGDFQNAWQYGLGKLGDAIKGTLDGVKQNQKVYSQVENQVAQAMSQLKGAL
jgi:hypothetical protein